MKPLLKWTKNCYSLYTSHFQEARSPSSQESSLYVQFVCVDSHHFSHGICCLHLHFSFALYSLLGDCWYVLHCFLLQCSVPYSFSQNEVQVLSRCRESRCTTLPFSLGRNDSLLLVYPIKQCLKKMYRLLCCIPSIWKRKT